ncbi:MAG: HdeD family acid-resistance protein [Ardenticatenaceae bacterium]|nr:HdeD family acid-resistance protein [Anaerolineales bacterium]MCB8980001.1 HdeD family acid-resistance protein [Ardenticatenaceae bacterium]
MLRSLSRYWWLLALRGAAAVIFGILAFIWPGLTLGALVILFGVYVLIDGVASLVAGFSHREENGRWWVTALEGVVGILAGVLTLVYPGITAVLLLYFIAAWAIITGVLELVAAIRLREEIDGEWALGLSGLISIFLGVGLIVFPSAGALALVWMIGTYAILFGGLLIYLAFKLRNEDKLELKHA